MGVNGEGIEVGWRLMELDGVKVTYNPMDGNVLLGQFDSATRDYADQSGKTHPELCEMTFDINNETWKSDLEKMREEHAKDLQDGRKIIELEEKYSSPENVCHAGHTLIKRTCMEILRVIHPGWSGVCCDMCMKELCSFNSAQASLFQLSL